MKDGVMKELKLYFPCQILMAQSYVRSYLASLAEYLCWRH